jgi:transposase-like protein
MLISLHKQAATTPKIRAAIQASTEPAWMVAERYGISEQTVWKWRKRDSIQDRSHTPHRLQTRLTPAQEAVAVCLRRTLLLPLEDLLAVVREFLNPHVSRSGLDRCLRRHGVGNLRDLKPTVPRPAHKPFKAYEPGYLHIDVKFLPQMADEDRRRYLFVAIDRATRWVFLRVYSAQTAANARRFLRDLERAAPMKITRVLIRRLLIVGAMSVIRWVVRKGGSTNRWLAALVARKPKMVAAVPLANKMARMIWAMTTKQENYRMA